MTVRTIYGCDFCGDETENPKQIDFLNVPIGDNPDPINKQICRKCIRAIDMARGRTV